MNANRSCNLSMLIILSLLIPSLFFQVQANSEYSESSIVHYAPEELSLQNASSTHPLIVGEPLYLLFTDQAQTQEGGVYIQSRGMIVAIIFMDARDSNGTLLYSESLSIEGLSLKHIDWSSLPDETSSVELRAEGGWENDLYVLIPNDTSVIVGNNLPTYLDLPSENDSIYTILYNITEKSAKISMKDNNFAFIDSLMPHELRTIVLSKNEYLEIEKKESILACTDFLSGASGLTTAFYPLPSSYKCVSQAFCGNYMGKNNHTGIDISAQNSNPAVLSLCKGVVSLNNTNVTKYTSLYEKYWNSFLVIAHDCNEDNKVDFFGYYGHISSTLSPKVQVKKGQSLGIIRDAYKANGSLDKANNHLHLSINSSYLNKDWGYYGLSCSDVKAKGWINPIAFLNFNNNQTDKPSVVSVTPASGSWTKSPQNININSSNATTIYYTMMNTYDGSTPKEPAAPSPSANNGSLKGPSAVFQLYARAGENKKTKLRFVGCNIKGCGSASSSYTYTLDLRAGPGTVSVSPASGSWTKSPQNINISSSNATTIYYTMVNTYDGSTPKEPAAPSPSANNGSLKGPSAVFQLYARAGENKKTKLRFVGCNSKGCGSASSSYTYQMNLQGESKPDLVVTNVWLKEGTNIKKGSRVHPYCTVKNIGSAHSGEFRLAYYIDANQKRDDDGVNSLCPGCSATESVGHDNIKLGDTGNRTLRCCVDYNKQVSESHEDNNCSTISFKVK